MIHLVHGIRSRNPKDTMGALRSALSARGFAAKIVDYGYILIPITNRRARRAVVEQVEDNSTVIAYSNGAPAVHKAVSRGKVKPAHVVLISPALPVDVTWPPFVESITVFYSPGDIAVAFGGFWAWVANCMPWRWGSAREHPWGRMGLKGADTPDSRVTNRRLPEKIAHSWFEYMDVVDTIAHTTARIYMED